MMVQLHTKKHYYKGVINIVIIVLLAFLAIVFYYFNFALPTSNLKRNKTLTVGTIYDVQDGGGEGGGYTLLYKFNVDGKEYLGIASCSDMSLKTAKHLFLNTCYEVVYDSLNPKNNNILNSCFDYKFYGVKTDRCSCVNGDTFLPPLRNR